MRRTIFINARAALVAAILATGVSACGDAQTSSQGGTDSGTTASNNPGTDTGSGTGTGTGTGAGGSPGSPGDPSFASTHYSGSSNCAECHDGLTDTQGQDISIVKAWSNSMMANTTRDPYWRAKIAAELKRNPQSSANINNACSRCHAPMANDAARKDGAAIEILGSGFLNPQNTYFDHAMDGVSCTLCHQIRDNGILGTPEASSGEFSVASYANAVDRPAYGQYADVLTDPMQMKVRYTPQLGAHTATSEMCATCHDLKTPFVDSAGNPVSTSLATRFPEQMVFTEWNNSDFRTGGSKEKTCQGCHMPVVAGAVPIASKPGMVQRREGFAVHDFLGANTEMLSILDANRSQLGVRATGLAGQIDRTRQFLKTAATIEVLSANVSNGVLEARVRVTNQTGHKLPTGYPSRRAWVHFLVQDASGRILFESGRLNPDGSIAGVAVDQDSSTYEPHYETITAADQVQVYEPVMGDTDDRVTHTLLRAARYLKDNRLTPSGFNKSAAPPDARVVGEAERDPDFDNGSDTITYRIAVGSATALRLTAELNYQAQSYGHLQDLFRDAAVPEVAAFKTMFDSRAVRSETLASVSATTN